MIKQVLEFKHQKDSPALDTALDLCMGIHSGTSWLPVVSLLHPLLPGTTPEEEAVKLWPKTNFILLREKPEWDPTVLPKNSDWNSDWNSDCPAPCG